MSSAALQRRGDDASVLPGRSAGTVRVSRAPDTVASASIIIPFRDEPRFLRACIDSIDQTSASIAPDYILVDNGSVQPETTTLLERLAVRPDVRVLRDDRPFNWAGLNNAAATLAAADVLVFLNNDIEALSWDGSTRCVARWSDLTWARSVLASSIPTTACNIAAS